MLVTNTPAQKTIAAQTLAARHHFLFI